ncbi:alpha/beta hydrolase-fold protein [uncultured Psychroserpens sp.]|uniref:alpha/beta hydrolase n=1 Tax=uncultured Psychroserpens sp. TaxID=255436 RepID=UPI0026304284|nr:alpha/beta hydrolase-fold protein [uncultured Psychroserpens sp.]
MKFRFIIFTKLFFLLIFISCSKADDSVTTDKVDIINIHSNIVNEDYVLYVYLPPSYENSSNDFPVLYQLDGDFTVELTIENAESLSSIEEFIIVGIDYLGNNKRERDFTPTYQEDFHDSGGADAFYDFLKTELIPYINSNYRVDSNFGNTLKGHSLGGLFATTALLKHNQNPNVFKNYIIESPSLWWDNGLMLSEEQEFSEANTSLDTKIYVSVGELEQVIQKLYFETFKTQLLSRNYLGLTSKFRILPNANHSDVRNNPEVLTYIYQNE